MHGQRAQKIMCSHPCARDVMAIAAKSRKNLQEIDELNFSRHNHRLCQYVATDAGIFQKESRHHCNQKLACVASTLMGFNCLCLFVFSRKPPFSLLSVDVGSSTLVLVPVPIYLTPSSACPPLPLPSFVPSFPPCLFPDSRPARPLITCTFYSLQEQGFMWVVDILASMKCLEV